MHYAGARSSGAVCSVQLVNLVNNVHYLSEKAPVFFSGSEIVKTAMPDPSRTLSRKTVGAYMNPDDLKTLSEDIKKRSPEELAQIRTNKIDTSLHAILIDKEFERRVRLEQHGLDLQLIAKQVRWMKFSVAATIISALLGVILGAYLQRNWLPAQPQMTTGSVEQKTIVSPSVHPEALTDEKTSSSQTSLGNR